MINIEVDAIPDGVETTSACHCCGQPVVVGHGVLRGNSGDVADYWYRWTTGDEMHFFVAISACSADGSPCGGVAVVACNCNGEKLVYSVVEPEDSPWPDSPVFGPILTRDQALSGNVVPDLFAIVDAISANESRLSSRILAATGA